MPREPDSVSDATFRVLLASGIGPVLYRRLMQRFGDHDAIAGASALALTSVEGIGEVLAGSLREALRAVEPDRERTAMRAHDARLLVLEDSDYPVLLKALPDPPPALWVRGGLSEDDRLAIAIVGSRRCTAYGREQAGRFASLLAQSGLTIVSGGALGIDGEAHRGALRAQGRTIVVMGCGLAECYPKEHDELFVRIVESGGALVSEFPMTMPPKAEHFPRRNRIISGLSLGVLVIEAALRSGALITARQAAEEHGREVMALPGRVDSPASAGCLKMLREGWAALVTSHADVLNQLDAASQLVRGALEAAGHENAVRSATLFDAALTSDQAAIVETLRDAGAALLVDQIAARTQLPMSRLMADLTLLQIRGRVRRDSSGVHLSPVAAQDEAAR